MTLEYSDVDECLIDNGGCDQTCNNTDGSFECSCEEGLVLAADNLNCEGTYVHRTLGELCMCGCMEHNNCWQGCLIEGIILGVLKALPLHCIIVGVAIKVVVSTRNVIIGSSAHH